MAKTMLSEEEIKGLSLTELYAARTHNFHAYLEQAEELKKKFEEEKKRLETEYYSKAQLITEQLEDRKKHLGDKI